MYYQPNAGEVVILIGANGLLGQEIFRKLIDFKISLIATYCHNESKKLLLNTKMKASKANIEYYKIDITNQEENIRFSDFIKRKYKKVDIIIHSVGIKLKKPALMTAFDDINKLFSINCIGVMHLTNQLLKIMIRNRSGRIIVLGSYAAKHGFPGQSIYAATKASLEIWVKSIAHEIGKYNITINTVLPGAIEDSNENLYTIEEIKLAKQKIALGRLGLPNEIANVVLWLCSSGSNYVNAATICVDGGSRF